MKTSLRKSGGRFVLIAGALLLTNAAAFAGQTWTGGGSTPFNWSDSNNWGGVQPGYGTISFAGTLGTTNTMDQSYNMNQINWNGASAWTMNSSNSSVLNLFDNSGTQAKIESLGTGGVTINAPITFAATTGNAWGEINSVSSSITFGSGATLTVNGSAVAGIRMFGGGTGIATTFNNTVSASGKYFATSAVGQTINIGGAFTSGDFYLMNNGTLNINSGSTFSASTVRLGGDFGTTGTQDLTKGATLNFTPAAGGLTYSGVINPVASNTSGALVVNSQNTSGTNTLSGQIALDSNLAITQAAGGTLNITQVKGGDNSTGNDIKSFTETFTPASGGSINQSGTIYNSTGSGSVVLNGAGTLTLSGTDTYTGTTTVNAGTLSLTGSLASPTLAIGGNSTFSYDKAGTNSQSFTTTNINLGNSSIKNTVSTDTLNLGALARTVGGTVNFTNTGTITTNTTNTSGIIGGYATVGGNTWAVNSTNAANGPITGLASFATDTWASGNNTNGTTNSTQTNATTNSLRFATNTGATTVTLTMNGTNVITSGGILVAPTISATTSIGVSGTSSILEGASGQDLVVINNSTNNFRIYSNIADNGPATGLTLSGNGAATTTATVLGGTNTYTGGTTLNAGATVAVENSAAFGTGTLNLAGGSIRSSGTGNGSYTVGNAVTISADTAIPTGGSTGSLTFSGPTTISGGTRTITQNNITGAYIFGGAIGDGGNGYGFTKAGAGTLILSGANTYTGATTISAGTLQIGNGSTTGSLSTSSTIIDNGNLTFNRSTTTTQGTDFTAAGITGTGSLTIAGGGTTILTTSANSFTGTTTINANSTLQLGAAGGGATGNISGTSSVVDNGNLTINRTSNTTQGVTLGAAGSIISGSGSFTQAGTGTTTLNAANTYSGGTSSTAGALVLGNSSVVTAGGASIASGPVGKGTLTLATGTTLRSDSATARTLQNNLSLSGNITLGDATNTGLLTFNSTDGTNTLTTAATIALSANTALTTASNVNFADGIGGGSFTLSKAGAGTLAFSGSVANTYTGLTTVSQGELDLNKTSALAMGGNLTINGGTVKWLQSNQLATSAMVLMTSGTLNLNGQSQTVVDLTNTGGTFVTGAGTWTGTGSSMTWGGGTNTINTGGSVFENHLTITAGNNEIQANGLVQLSLTGLTMNGGTVTIDSDPSTPGKLALMSNVTANDGTTSNIVTSGIVGAATDGVIDLTGGTRTFTVGNTNAATALNISANIIGTGAGLTKAGPGTLTLTGANTYTGATAVNAGSLYVNGSTSSSSAVTVSNSGTTLGGNGTIGGTVSVGSGANFSPGPSGVGSTGIVHTGALTLSSGSNYNVDLINANAGTGYDQVIAPSLALAGANLVLSVGTLSAGQQFVIADNTGASAVSGTFNGLAEGSSFTQGGDAFTISYIYNADGGATGNDILLTVTAVPEPATWAIGALVLGALLLTHRTRLTRIARR